MPLSRYAGDAALYAGTSVFILGVLRIAVRW